ncbi:unnamed protein product [Symbiodinium sp. CCMP2592]|nr:unnamed protein product [Symbiodinium sp. CCMP2592]
MGGRSGVFTGPGYDKARGPQRTARKVAGGAARDRSAVAGPGKFGGTRVGLDYDDLYHGALEPADSTTLRKYAGALLENPIRRKNRKLRELDRYGWGTAYLVFYHGDRDPTSYTILREHALNGSIYNDVYHRHQRYFEDPFEHPISRKYQELREPYLCRTLGTHPVGNGLDDLYLNGSFVSTSKPFAPPYDPTTDPWDTPWPPQTHEQPGTDNTHGERPPPDDSDRTATPAAHSQQAQAQAAAPAGQPLESDDEELPLAPPEEDEAPATQAAIWASLTADPGQHHDRNDHQLEAYLHSHRPPPPHEPASSSTDPAPASMGKATQKPLLKSHPSGQPDSNPAKASMPPRPLPRNNHRQQAASHTPPAQTVDPPTEDLWSQLRATLNQLDGDPVLSTGAISSTDVSVPPTVTPDLPPSRQQPEPPQPPQQEAEAQDEQEEPAEEADDQEAPSHEAGPSQNGSQWADETRTPPQQLPDHPQPQQPEGTDRRTRHHRAVRRVPNNGRDPSTPHPTTADSNDPDHEPRNTPPASAAASSGAHTDPEGTPQPPTGRAEKHNRWPGEQRTRNKEHKSAVQAAFQQRGWVKPEHLTWKEAEKWLYPPGQRSQARPQEEETNWAELLNRHLLPIGALPQQGGTHPAGQATSSQQTPTATPQSATQNPLLDPNQHPSPANTDTTAAATLQDTSQPHEPPPASTATAAGATEDYDYNMPPHHSEDPRSKQGTAARADAEARGLAEPTLSHTASTQATGHDPRPRPQQAAANRTQPGDPRRPRQYRQRLHLRPHKALVTWLENGTPPTLPPTFPLRRNNNLVCLYRGNGRWDMRVILTSPGGRPFVAQGTYPQVLLDPTNTAGHDLFLPEGVSMLATPLGDYASCAHQKWDLTTSLLPKA